MMPWRFTAWSLQDRRAALISLKSGLRPRHQSRATDRVDSGLLLSESDVVSWAGINAYIR